MTHIDLVKYLYLIFSPKTQGGLQMQTSRLQYSNKVNTSIPKIIFLQSLNSVIYTRNLGVLHFPSLGNSSIPLLRQMKCRQSTLT